MSKANLSHKIHGLLQQGEYEEARRLLEAEQEKCPEDHWLLTQMGVTFYEQKDYESALKLFLASLKLVADCPLTLWNLAGTLDALRNPTTAIRIYAWLLGNKTSPHEDPCWESEE